MKFTNIMCMPTSMSIFATTATHILGTVTDLKHMARYFDYLLPMNLVDNIILSFEVVEYRDR